MRPDDRGEFDELMLYDASGECIVHFEMMDDNQLWIGLSLPGTEDEIHVNISARGKLKIMVREE